MLVIGRGLHVLLGAGGGGEEVFRTVIPPREFPFKLKALNPKP